METIKLNRLLQMNGEKNLDTNLIFATPLNEILYSNVSTQTQTEHSTVDIVVSHIGLIAKVIILKLREIRSGKK